MSDTTITRNWQSRRFLLTINNPDDYGYTEESLKLKLGSLKSCIYYCFSKEIGNVEHTPHYHVYIVYKYPKLFSTIKKAFPEAHIDKVLGTHSQARDYVLKDGKWKDTDKEDTRIDGTQIEFGTLPPDRASTSDIKGVIYELIKDGLSTYEILELHPECMGDISTIERVRLILKEEEYRHTFRKLEVTYIYGKTGTGKSRSVMEQWGYENVYRVTDYAKHPFDTYNGQDVVVFEEFRSSLQIQDMLNYLDGYPLTLPARYSNKVACFTKVYILTNIPLESQYQNIQRESAETWNAFLRRINKVICYKSAGNIIEYNSMSEYLCRNAFFHEPDDIDKEEIPFT